MIDNRLSHAALCMSAVSEMVNVVAEGRTHLHADRYI